MHDPQTGLLSTEGYLLISACGIALLALGCVMLAYLLVRFSAEDRHAMDRVDQTVALFAPRGDDKERRDDAHDSAVVSQVRLDLSRDLAGRRPSSVNRRVAEAREGRPVPPQHAA
jgi:hypothetical protein